MQKELENDKDFSVQNYALRQDKIKNVVPPHN